MVVPTWNGGPRFLEVLEILARQDIEGGFQLVVIDSGSRDGTVEAARAAGALVAEIPNSEFNHGATRNRGIEHASGEIVCLLTQDALPMDEQFVSALAKGYDDPSIDGAYARQFPMPAQDPILAERLRRWSASRTESMAQELAAGDPAASAARYAELEPLERLTACAFDNVASSVRRSTWERHPFPSASFGEDVSWGKRVLLDGGRILFQADARVEHSHPIDMLKDFKRLYCDHRNLHQLHGVRTVPTWGHVWRGWRPQARYYGELVDAAPDLSERQQRYWKRYAYPFSLLEASAQFLGARSWWKAEQSRLWGWFDRRIRRGV